MHKISAATLTVFGVIGFVFVIQAQAPNGPAVGRGTEQTYRVPRTPWGDPDLQGKWPSGHMTGVPLQRAESFGTRNELTDARLRPLARRFRTPRILISRIRASRSARSVADSRRHNIGSSAVNRSARPR